MYALNSMRSLSDVENEALYRSFTGADLLLRFIRLANTEKTYFIRSKTIESYLNGKSLK